MSVVATVALINSICSSNYQKIVDGKLNYVTPEMFGAKGDGETDDTEAIQSAIDSGKPVVLAKSYLVTETLALSEAGAAIEGTKHASIICQSNITVFSVTANRCSMNNLYIVGNGTGTAIACTSQWNSFNNCYISNFANGITLTGSTGSVFHGVMLQSIVTCGIAIAGDNNDNYFSNCIVTMKEYTGKCMRIINNVQAMIFTGCSFLKGEYCVELTDSVTAPASNQYSEYVQKVPSHCKFVGCFFDSATSVGVITGNSQDISFSNCWFSCRPGYGVRVNGYSMDIQFNNCEFFYNRCGIRIGNHAKGITVNGCVFNTNGSLSVSETDTRTSSASAFDIWVTETPTDYIISNCKFSNDGYGSKFYNNTKSAAHIVINENTGTTNGIITGNVLSTDCTWKTTSNLTYIAASVIANNIPSLS